MEYQEQSNTFILSPEEFKNLMNARAAYRQSMSGGKDLGETRIVERPVVDLENLSSEKQQLIERCVNTLDAPKRTFQILQSILNEEASRYTAVLDAVTRNEVVILYDTGEHLSLQNRKLEDWIFELEKFLAIDASLPEKGIQVQLSAQAVVVLLAILDFYQYAYHSSCLTHTVPIESFSIKEIEQQLDEADKSDYRWILMSFAMVFPAKITNSFEVKDLAQALDELVKAEFIEMIAEAEGKSIPAIYALTREMLALKQSIFFAVGRLSMRITGTNPDGSTGVETLQFIRDGTGLSMFGVAGDKGVFSRLGQADWDLLLERLIPDEKAAEQGTVRLRAAKPAFCIKCGAATARDSKFCPKCGAKMPVSK